MARARDGRHVVEPNGSGGHLGEDGRPSFSLRAFLHHEAFGGILLLASALVALVWANSPWSEHYTNLWRVKVQLGAVRFN